MVRLIKCRDCGQPISRKAESCPQCGSPGLKSQRQRTAGFGYLVLLLAVVAGWVILRHGGNDIGPSGLLNTGSSTDTVSVESDNHVGVNNTETTEALIARERLYEIAGHFDNRREYIGQWLCDDADLEIVAVYRICRRDSLLFMETSYVFLSKPTDVIKTETELVAVLDDGERRFVASSHKDEYVAGRYDPQYYVINLDGSFSICGLDTGESERYPSLTIDGSDRRVRLVKLDDIDFIPISKMSYDSRDVEHLSPETLTRLRENVRDIQALHRELQKAHSGLNPRSADPNEIEAWDKFDRRWQQMRKDILHRVELLDRSVAPFKAELSLLVGKLLSMQQDFAFGATVRYQQQEKAVERTAQDIAGPAIDL